jgi:hypothetical protein
MPYAPIFTPADLNARLVVGQTREDHWLDFKSQLGGDNVENAGDVAQFANASGGVLVIGAQESNEILSGFNSVPDPPKVIARIEGIVKGHLTPVPVIEPHAIELAPGLQIVVVNVPPSLVLIARHEKYERFEFLIRGHESKRHMTLMEVEARLQNKERAMQLRIQQIPEGAKLRLDALIQGMSDRGWIVRHVDDHAVTLSHDGRDAIIPLAYVEAVYQATDAEADIAWVLGASCTLLGSRGGALVAKYNLPAHLRTS